MQSIAKICGMFNAKIGPGREYENIADFCRRSGVTVSFETIARLLHRGKPVSIPILMLIAKHLDFTPAEIKEILKLAGDEEFSSLIGDHAGIQLTEQESALIEAWRALKSKNILADQIELVSKMDGVNISKQLTKLKRGKKG